MQLIYGIHPVTNAIKSGRAKKLIWAQEGRDKQGGNKQGGNKPAARGKRLSPINTASLPVEYWPKPRFDDQFPGANHQFCAAECADFEFQDISNISPQTPSHSPATIPTTRKGKVSTPLYLALDGITDPRNMGACIRSAVAFSCAGLIFPAANSAELNAACVKSSAGMIEWLPLFRVSNLERSLNLLQERGLWLVAAAGQGEQTINDIDCQRALVLLMGTEGKGLGRLLLQRSDYVCRIDISEQADSLNVSAASAVMLHNIRLRQDSR